jgi:hypothetical protein
MVAALMVVVVVLVVVVAAFETSQISVVWRWWSVVGFVVRSKYGVVCQVMYGLCGVGVPDQPGTHQHIHTYIRIGATRHTHSYTHVRGELGPYRHTISIR